MRKNTAVIIGGGLAAWVTAAILSQLRVFKKVVLISSKHLHTASLHNQSWLQAGTIYNLDNPLERQVAEFCIQYGRYLLEMQNRRMSRDAGIMAVADSNAAVKKIEFLKKFGFTYQQPIIPANEVLSLLGEDLYGCEQFQEKTTFIHTPDQTFPEGDLLRFCQKVIKHPVAGTNVQWIQGDANLHLDSLAPSGYTVRVDQEEFAPDTLFVMAGMYTKTLLAPLGFADQIQLLIRRCILLRTPDIFDLGPEIFIDKICGTNINTVKDGEGNKNFLLGDGLYTTVTDIHSFEFSKLPTDQEVDRFVYNYFGPGKYPHLRAKVADYAWDKSKYSVCYKAESESYLPWQFSSNEIAPHLPNIFGGGPGKATLSYYFVRKIMEKAGINNQLPRFPVFPIATEDPGSALLQMWFERN